MRNVLISFIISGLLICGYHLYLKRKGVFDGCIKGVYTVNLNESIEAVKRNVLSKTLKGDSIDPQKELLKIQAAIDKLALKLPSGYLLLPDSVVLGGNRKRINLLTGKVTEVKKNTSLTAKK